MRLRGLLQSDPSAKLSIWTSLGVLVLMAVFTLVSLAALLSDNVARVDGSRLINTGYAALSVFGEILALIGIIAALSAVRRKRGFSLALILGLTGNLIGFFFVSAGHPGAAAYRLLEPAGVFLKSGLSRAVTISCGVREFKDLESNETSQRSGSQRDTDRRLDGYHRRTALAETT